MDRIIEVKVFGNHLTKDSNRAGTRSEANVAKLRVTFDESWDNFEKTIIFWDAYGENAVRVVPEHEDVQKSTRIYLATIPAEAMARTGELTFTIKGTSDTQKQTVTGKLEVEDTPDMLDPIAPTPDEMTQLKQQWAKASEDVQGAYTARDEAVAAKKEAETAKEQAETAKGEAETAKNEAVEAKEKAEQAKADADTIKSDTETIRNEAVSAKVGAETARSEAEYTYLQTLLIVDEANTAKTEAETAKANALNYAMNAELFAEEAKTAKEQAEATKGETLSEAKAYTDEVTILITSDMVDAVGNVDVTATLRTEKVVCMDVDSINSVKIIVPDQIHDGWMLKVLNCVQFALFNSSGDFLHDVITSEPYNTLVRYSDTTQEWETQILDEFGAPSKMATHEFVKKQAQELKDQHEADMESLKHKADLDETGKVPISQLPDNIGGDVSMTPPDLSYEIVEGVKLNTQGKALVEDTGCFTVYIKIPDKKFAAIYATAKNATVLVSTTTYNSAPAICDADKNPIANNDGVYNKSSNSQGNVLTVFGANYINNYENPVYCALSYTNGTKVEIGLFAADAVNESYLPVSTTDLPKDFIVNGENLVTGLYNIQWSTNGYFQYNKINNTNLFEVATGDTLYANAKFLGFSYYDENYAYLGSGTTGTNASPVTIEMENVKYAYAAFATGYEVADLWISKVDLSRRKHKPPRKVNPKYVDLYDIDRNQIKSWYNGKRITFMGDSLTGTGSGSQYITYLDNFFGFGAKTNCGVGGTCVSGNGSMPFWSDERVNAVDIDSDIIFIAGGTNDANNSLAIGENNISNCDVTTFYGAYHVLLSKLIYKFYKLETGYYSDIDYSGVTQVETVKPVKIFLVTPPYMMGSETAYNKTPAYAEAVIDIGKLLGFPVCDTRANSGVNIMLAEYYKTLNANGSSDYIHLNDDAHKEWAKVMIGKMLEVEPIE